MADSAIHFLLNKLSTFLVQQASSISDVHDEIEEINLELESMSSFIRDADRRKEMNLSVKTWVKQVREVAYKVEDIVDEYIHYKDSSTERNDGKKLKHFFQDAIGLPKSVNSRRKLYNKLQKVKTKIHMVSERSKEYCFDRIEEGRSRRNSSTDWWLHNGDTSFFLDEEEIVVGIDENEEKLLQWLTEDEARRTVTSVLGMAGVGKTTLVTKVYNHPIIKQDFACWAWISVSQTYEVEELLRTMVKELLKTNPVTSPTKLGSMSYRQLVEMLIGILRDKRYVIVLDDVWSIDLWSRIRGAFPDSSCGSRIIFTTRNENTASSVGPGSRIHPLKPLKENEAWVLFCQKAFWNDPERTCPKELEKLAETIVRKCEGLPLAIVAIGGLLGSRNKTVVEWKTVHDSLNWQLSNNPMLGRVKGMLLLSFSDLPFYLKPCFLYCCIFRGGYPIKRKKLIRLWIAEGFIIERKGLEIEEVADEYLRELILRSMIQVTEINDGGRVKTCKVHDVMRELAVTILEEENFCMTYDGSGSMLGVKFQRLSAYNRFQNISMSKNMSRHLRSFFVFGSDTCSSSSLQALSKHFKLLRVLEIEGVCVDGIPSTLVSLFNLRYLNLKGTKVKELPKSMERLTNLQTLDIRNTNVERLPSGISKLRNIRHLFIGQHNVENSKTSDFPSGMQAPSGIWNCHSLQTLSCIEADEELIKKVGCLSELKRLDIVELRAIDGPNLCTSLQNLGSLRCLSVKAKAEEELQLESLSSPPLFLQKLTLVGPFKSFPQWIGTLESLTNLCLVSSNLEKDILFHLHTLTALVFLEIKKASEEKLLHFKAGWFPKLHKLHLLDLVRLDSVIIDEGSLPSIKEMCIARCSELKLLPQGLEYLSSLRKLELEDMPMEFVQLLRFDSEEVEAKVGHISTINHVSVTEQGRLLEILR